MGNASSRSPDRAGKIPPALQASGWSLVAGIAAVLAAIYFLDSSRAFFSEDSRQAPGGILFTGRSGQADSQLGATSEFHAITAAVGGGCSLSGGVGSIRDPCSASP